MDEDNGNNNGDGGDGSVLILLVCSGPLKTTNSSERYGLRRRLPARLRGPYVIQHGPCSNEPGCSKGKVAACLVSRLRFSARLYRQAARAR
jgi:hypothetical protein